VLTDVSGILIFLEIPTSKMNLSLYFPSPINYLHDQFTKPLGGAETAVLRIVEALRFLGRTVEICDREDPSFSFSDVLLVTRFPLAVRVFRQKFQRVYFWSPDDTTHGTFAPLRDPGTLAEFNALVDGVLAISNYQYENLAALGVKPAKLMRTRYGIDISLYPQRNHPPDPVCIYTSSPKRGLELLPFIWPEIHASVPEARLWIYSSMATYRKDDSSFIPLYQALQKLPNVTCMGAVGQEQLAAALSRVRVFLYPNTFNETASVATLEARAAGCAIITTRAGALIESAESNCLIDPQPNRVAFARSFIQPTVQLLRDDSLYMALASHNQCSAFQYDWKVIASEWTAQLGLDAPKPRRKIRSFRA
jgi:glycosyltransferase involved in cell wall biosynthesis